MSRDRVSHTDILKRAAKISDRSFSELQKNAHVYLDALAQLITEADPVRDIRVYNLGMLRVNKHEAHVGQDMHRGEAVEIPAHRVVTFEPTPRIKSVLRSPVYEFYTQDEFD